MGAPALLQADCASWRVASRARLASAPWPSLSVVIADVRVLTDKDPQRQATGAETPGWVSRTDRASARGDLPDDDVDVNPGGWCRCRGPAAWRACA